MRRSLLALMLVLFACSASDAASITCAISGSSIANANNQRVLTITDTDLQKVLDWIKADQLQLVANQFNNGVVTGFNPTTPQLEWGWFQASIVTGTIQAQQVHGTTPAVVPPPIGLQ